MRPRREYRDRDEVEVQILEALVERSEVGMTVFEIRSSVDVDIETLEAALANLREDDLILVDYSEDRSVIRPHERVVDAKDGSTGSGGVGWMIDRVREIIDR